MSQPTTYEDNYVFRDTNFNLELYAGYNLGIEWFPLGWRRHSINIESIVTTIVTPHFGEGTYNDITVAFPEYIHLYAPEEDRPLPSNTSADIWSSWEDIIDTIYDVNRYHDFRRRKLPAEYTTPFELNRIAGVIPSSNLKNEDGVIAWILTSEKTLMLINLDESKISISGEITDETSNPVINEIIKYLKDQNRDFYVHGDSTPTIYSPIFDKLPKSSLHNTTYSGSLKRPKKYDGDIIPRNLTKNTLVGSVLIRNDTVDLDISSKISEIEISGINSNMFYVVGNRLFMKQLNVHPTSTRYELELTVKLKHSSNEIVISNVIVIISSGRLRTDLVTSKTLIERAPDPGDTIDRSWGIISIVSDTDVNRPASDFTYEITGGNTAYLKLTGTDNSLLTTLESVDTFTYNVISVELSITDKSNPARKDIITSSIRLANTKPAVLTVDMIRNYMPCTAASTKLATIKVTSGSVDITSFCRVMITENNFPRMIQIVSTNEVWLDTAVDNTLFKQGETFKYTIKVITNMGELLELPVVHSLDTLDLLLELEKIGSSFPLHYSYFHTPIYKLKPYVNNKVYNEDGTEFLVKNSIDNEIYSITGRDPTAAVVINGNILNLTPLTYTVDNKLSIELVLSNGIYKPNRVNILEDIGILEASTLIAKDLQTMLNKPFDVEVVLCEVETYVTNSNVTPNVRHITTNEDTLLVKNDVDNIFEFKFVSGKKYLVLKKDTVLLESLTELKVTIYSKNPADVTSNELELTFPVKWLHDYPKPVSIDVLTIPDDFIVDNNIVADVGAVGSKSNGVYITGNVTYTIENNAYSSAFEILGHNVIATTEDIKNVHKDDISLIIKAVDKYGVTHTETIPVMVKRTLDLDVNLLTVVPYAAIKAGNTLMGDITVTERTDVSVPATDLIIKNNGTRTFHETPLHPHVLDIIAKKTTAGENPVNLGLLKFDMEVKTKYGDINKVTHFYWLEGYNSMLSVLVHTKIPKVIKTINTVTLARISVMDSLGITTDHTQTITGQDKDNINFTTDGLGYITFTIDNTFYSDNTNVSFTATYVDKFDNTVSQFFNIPMVWEHTHKPARSLEVKYTKLAAEPVILKKDGERMVGYLTSHDEYDNRDMTALSTFSIVNNTATDFPFEIRNNTEVWVNDNIWKVHVNSFIVRFKADDKYSTVIANEPLKIERKLLVYNIVSQTGDIDYLAIKNGDVKIATVRTYEYTDSASTSYVPVNDIPLVSSNEFDYVLKTIARNRYDLYAAQLRPNENSRTRGKARTVISTDNSSRPETDVSIGVNRYIVGHNRGISISTRGSNGIVFKNNPVDLLELVIYYTGGGSAGMRDVFDNCEISLLGADGGNMKIDPLTKMLSVVDSSLLVVGESIEVIIRVKDEWGQIKDMHLSFYVAWEFGYPKPIRTDMVVHHDNSIITKLPIPNARFSLQLRSRGSQLTNHATFIITHQDVPGAFEVRNGNEIWATDELWKVHVDDYVLRVVGVELYGVKTTENIALKIERKLVLKKYPLYPNNVIPRTATDTSFSNNGLRILEKFMKIGIEERTSPHNQNSIPVPGNNLNIGYPSPIEDNGYNSIDFTHELSLKIDKQDYIPRDMGVIDWGGTYSNSTTPPTFIEHFRDDVRLEGWDYRLGWTMIPSSNELIIDYSENSLYLCRLAITDQAGNDVNDQVSKYETVPGLSKECLFTVMNNSVTLVYLKDMYDVDNSGKIDVVVAVTDKYGKKEIINMSFNARKKYGFTSPKTMEVKMTPIVTTIDKVDLPLKVGTVAVAEQGSSVLMHNNCPLSITGSNSSMFEIRNGNEVWAIDQLWRTQYNALSITIKATNPYKPNQAGSTTTHSFKVRRYISMVFNKISYPRDRVPLRDWRTQNVHVGDITLSEQMNATNTMRATPFDCTVTVADQAHNPPGILLTNPSTGITRVHWAKINNTMDVRHLFGGVFVRYKATLASNVVVNTYSHVTKVG